jgi:hypothetical protein
MAYEGNEKGFSYLLGTLGIYSIILSSIKGHTDMLLQPTTFLDFSTKGNLSDVVRRFGNPSTITDSESKVNFTFQRSQYIFGVQVDDKANIIQMTATGFNKSVSYNKVRLGDDFSTVIKNCGNPSSFEIQEDEIHLNFEDCAYQLDKLKGLWTVTQIKVWSKTNGNKP